MIPSLGFFLCRANDVKQVHIFMFGSFSCLLFVLALLPSHFCFCSCVLFLFLSIYLSIYIYIYTIYVVSLRVGTIRQKLEFGGALQCRTQQN